MQDAFHVHFKDRIQTPIDPDIAVSLGAAQSGLAENLIQRPIGAPTIIAPKSYVIGMGPNRATRAEGTEDSRDVGVVVEVFEYELDLDIYTFCITSLMESSVSGHIIWLSKARC